MAKFVFKLQVLLNLKSQIEKNMMNEFAKEAKKLENEKNILKNFLNEQDNYLNSFNQELEKKVPISYLKAFNNYLSFLKKRIEFQKKTINKFEKSVDIIRVKLIKVIQERKVLEKLKEKDFEVYLKEELLKEQKLSDEIASYKHFDKINK